MRSIPEGERRDSDARRRAEIRQLEAKQRVESEGRARRVLLHLDLKNLNYTDGPDAFARFFRDGPRKKAST